MTETNQGPYVVGVDCGTQSAKVVIYDARGHEVSRGRQVLRPMDRPRPGVAVHPDDDLWDSICAASQDAMSNFTGNVSEIVAVGLCPIRCCKAFLRSDGSLVEPVLSWMDERAYQPYVPANPDFVFATTLSGYIAHRFTRCRRDTAANNISSQWPIDTDTWQWSNDPLLFSKFGIRREMLFDLQMPGEIIGPITIEAATKTGFPVGIPAVATANDKAVEMLAVGSLNNETALVSLGTYIAAMVHGDVNHRSPANFWTNFASISNRYLYESNGIRRGMWTVTWFLDLLGREVAERAESLGLSREEYLEPEASEVPAGSDGLVTVLDWLASADTPFRKGVLLGFDARHTRGHIYRSILEAIALTMKLNVDSMARELDTSLNEIVLSGGGSASPLMMQIFADVFNLPTSRNLGGGGASLGAAMCAAKAVGLFPDVETAAETMASSRETFIPNPANTTVYRKLLDAGYADIRAATDTVLKNTYAIFD